MVCCVKYQFLWGTSEVGLEFFCVRAQVRVELRALHLVINHPNGIKLHDTYDTIICPIPLSFAIIMASSTY
jgi:hypothetical protein